MILQRLGRDQRFGLAGRAALWPRVAIARILVGVRGAGVAYDGLYYVSSVTHNIKHGEYKQSFQLSRDGLISLTPLVMP